MYLKVTKIRFLPKKTNFIIQNKMTISKMSNFDTKTSLEWSRKGQKLKSETPMSRFRISFVIGRTIKIYTT